MARTWSEDVVVEDIRRAANAAEYEESVSQLANRIASGDPLHDDFEENAFLRAVAGKLLLGYRQTDK